MAISPSEDALRIEPEPDAEQAAAIAVAIASYLDRNTNEASEEPDRWRFAGRLAAQTGKRCPRRAHLPTDFWRAAGRVYR